MGYDRRALDSRKQNKPSGLVTELAAAMGVELLTEKQYRVLQELGEFDTKPSSWIATGCDGGRLAAQPESLDVPLGPSSHAGEV